MATSNSIDMLRSPVISTFFKYSLPWTLSFLFVSSAGIVDGIFIGHYEGPLALAAINIVWPVFALFMGVSIAFAAGGAVRGAAYLAQNNEAAAKAIFTKCLMAALCMSTFVALICFFFTTEVITLLGADETVGPLSITYLNNVGLFFPFQIMGFTISYFLRVDQRPNLASLGLVSTAITNIVLDYIFIALFDWGVAGAALATGCGYAAMFITYILGYFCNKKSRRLYLTRAVGQWRETFMAMWNGISEMINEVSTGLVLILINIVIMRLEGPYGVAAFTVVSYLNWLCLILSYGFADSLAPLVSANHTCRLHRRTLAFLRTAVCSVAAIGTFCFLITTLFPHELTAFFVPSDATTSNMAVTFMSISKYMFFFCGTNLVLTAYLTGLMQATASAIVALLRTLVLPALFITTLPTFMGYQGVALALPLSELICFLVAAALSYRLSVIRKGH